MQHRSSSSTAEASHIRRLHRALGQSRTRGHTDTRGVCCLLHIDTAPKLLIGLPALPPEVPAVPSAYRHLSFLDNVRANHKRLTWPPSLLFFLPAQHGPNPEEQSAHFGVSRVAAISKSTCHPDSWACWARWATFAGDGQIEKGRSAAPVPVPLIAQGLARTSTSPRTATSWNKSVVWLFISSRRSITALREEAWLNA